MKPKRAPKRARQRRRAPRVMPPLRPLPGCVAALKPGEKLNNAQHIAVLEWMQDCIRDWIAAEETRYDAA